MEQSPCANAIYLIVSLSFAWTDGKFHLAAAVLGSQVPEEVRQARRDALISQQQDISQAFAESLVGREVCFPSPWHDHIVHAPAA